MATDNNETPANDARYFTTAPTQEGDVSINDYSIHYKIFGNSKRRILLVMGLKGTLQNFFPLVNHFSKSNSVLVFDNRGAGKSTEGYLGRYTTKGMAADAQKVLETVKWIEDRSVNLVGISMGGMISQELAFLIPKRFCSLTLMATYAYFTWPSPKVAFGFLKSKKDGKDDIEELMSRYKCLTRLFNDEDWLNAFDERYPDHKDNRTRLYDFLMSRRTESPDRTYGVLGQLTAIMTHRMTPERLAMIGKNIPQILCIVGNRDKMIDPKNTDYLVEHLGCRKVVLENKGHSLIHEAELEIIPIIEEMLLNEQ